MATVLVSVVSVVLARYFASREQIRQDIRSKKIPVYESFLGFWFGYLMKDKPGAKPVSDEDLFNAMREFTETLMLWGSDDVVAKWSKYRRLSIEAAEPGAERTSVLFEFEELLLAIRRDLGHTNKGIARGDLLGMFVNDISNFV